MQEKWSPLKRYEGNPILTPGDMPFEAYTVFNAGAIRFKGKYLLLLRVENYKRETGFYTAVSDDGIKFTVSAERINYPLRDIEKKYGFHRFDMRITPLDGTYYVCHAIWFSSLGSCIGMARTDDFVNFEPLPSVSVPSNRNAFLFPEKINGLYARLERPQHISGSGIMWVSYSPDLVYWGNSQPVRLPATDWGSRKTGAGAMPIKTKKGWLEIYHGTCTTASTENYYLGVCLLELKDPSIVLACPAKFILAPEMQYECVGQVPNVVFAGGAVETDDGKLNVYYGGADTCMCLAQTTVDELLDFCIKNG